MWQRYDAFYAYHSRWKGIKRQEQGQMVIGGLNGDIKVMLVYPRGVERRHPGTITPLPCC